MLVDQCKLREFFDDAIELPNCKEKTRAYIINIFASISTEKDFSNEPLTFTLKRAHDRMCFKNFQELGDWLFFVKSMFPGNLKGATPAYYDSIARTSYYRCFLLLNKEWLLYEELADQFSEYTQTINQSLGAALKHRLPAGFSHHGFF